MLVNFYKTVLGMAGVRALVIIISFVGSVILTRFIGAEGRGIYAWFISCTVIMVALVQFGMEGVNRRYIAENADIAGSLARFTIKLCAIGTLIATPFFIYHGLMDDIGSSNFAMLISANILIFFMAICQCLCGSLLGLHRTNEYSISMALQKIINTVFIIILAVIGWISPLSAIIILLLSHIIQSLLNIYYLRGELKDYVKPWREVIPNIKSYSMYLYISHVLGIISLSIIPIFLASNYSLKSAGWFATSMIIMDAIVRTFGILNLYALPKLSSIKDVNERKRLRDSIKKIGFLAIIAIAFVWFFISDFVIILLFGEDFSGAIPVLKILCFALVFISLNNMYISFLTSAHEGKIIIAAPLVMVITILISSYFLIPLHGAIGGAVALTLGALLAMITSIISYRRLCNSPTIRCSHPEQAVEEKNN